MFGVHDFTVQIVLQSANSSEAGWSWFQQSVLIGQQSLVVCSSSIFYNGSVYDRLSKKTAVLVRFRCFQFS
jgi:hypothetical protein